MLTQGQQQICKVKGDRTRMAQEIMESPAQQTRSKALASDCRDDSATGFALALMGLLCADIRDKRESHQAYMTAHHLNRHFTRAS